MTSKRKQNAAKCGRLEINQPAARMMRCCWRGLTAASPIAGSVLCLTSTKASSLPRRAIISISPAGVRHLRARMRYPLKRRNQAAIHSARRPARSERRRLRRFNGLSADPAPGDRLPCGADLSAPPLHQPHPANWQRPALRSALHQDQ